MGKHYTGGVMVTKALVRLCEVVGSILQIPNRNLHNLNHNGQWRLPHDNLSLVCPFHVSTNNYSMQLVQFPHHLPSQHTIMPCGPLGYGHIIVVQL
jgi:hypothetical protein